MGKEEYAADYRMVMWHFASYESLERFLSSPADFMPKYHGYCGWALIHGRLRIGLVELWRVKDGELYFLCSEEALERWKSDEEANREKADEAWHNMLQKESDEAAGL